MKRLALAILLVAACSGKGKQEKTGAGSGVYAKKVVVTWGIQPKGSAAEVFLQTTDEIGKQVSHPIGTFEGECKVIKPAAEMKAVTGVNCTASGSQGIELHAVVNAPQIIVLKMKVELGVTPDPMAREEISRVAVPSGAAIEAGD